MCWVPNYRVVTPFPDILSMFDQLIHVKCVNLSYLAGTLEFCAGSFVLIELFALNNCFLHVARLCVSSTQ